MTRPRKKGYFDTKALAKVLRDLTESLPSEDEKAEIDGRLKQLTQFIDDLRSKLALLPSKGNAEQTASLFQWLEEFGLRARDSNAMSNLLGLPARRLSRGIKSPFTEVETEDAKRLLDGSQQLSIEEMQSRFRDESKYSTRQLYALAALVGVRVTAKTNRDALIDQLLTKIANYRGYQNLSGESGAGRKEPA